jgi:hypothetical protein
MKTSMINLVLGGIAFALIFLLLVGVESKSYNPNEPHRKYIGKHSFETCSIVGGNEKHIWNNSDIVQITAKRVLVANYPYRIEAETAFKDEVTGHLIYTMRNPKGERVQLLIEPKSDSTIVKITLTNLRTKKSKIFSN